jgi:3-deoxy-7-phosphoheptulonate synthase
VQQPPWPDQDYVARVRALLESVPPIAVPTEVDRLQQRLGEVARGEAFLLQGGDCAETFIDNTEPHLRGTVRTLLQMAVVLTYGTSMPVVKVGRFAGQYAKPRSNPIEVREGVSLPSYFGDLVNRLEFTAAARVPDPELLIQGYLHAGLTINFVRSLSAGGFADLHHPEFWDLAHLQRADLSVELRQEYQRMVRQLGEALRFMEALGESTVDELTRVEFFTSHEGLSLHYEAAQTKTVPRREGHYDLTTHLPWIGERTRALDGAHVEFFRGIRNPVGVKIGGGTSPGELLALIDRLNPSNEPGKLLLVARCGAAKVKSALPPLVEAVKREGRQVLWVCDPMHGNGRVTAGGIKTRDFNDILSEVEASFDIHDAAGSRLGGVHFELTGDDVTECIGGGLCEADLDRNYASACDPRLNYRQALEMAFRLAKRMDRNATSGP